MAVTIREREQTPNHERRALRKKLDEKMAELAELGKDRASAEATIEEWKKNAWQRLEMLADIAFPMNTPSDPTTAAVLFGRIQGFMEPMRRSLDVLGITGQMKANADKVRDRLNELEEEEREMRPD